jgi:hypothetical protein
MLESHAFSTTAVASAPDILNGRSIIEFLESKYTRGCIFGLDNLYKGYYLYMGWCYNFLPYLKTYLVKQYGNWQEYKAPNKTLLRRSLYGKVEKVIEI